MLYGLAVRDSAKNRVTIMGCRFPQTTSLDSFEFMACFCFYLCVVGRSNYDAMKLESLSSLLSYPSFHRVCKFARKTHEAENESLVYGSKSSPRFCRERLVLSINAWIKEPDALPSTPRQNYFSQFNSRTKLML